MQSSVSFPRTRPDSLRESSSWRESFLYNSGRDTRMSITHRDVALEVHDLVYGATSEMTTETVVSNLERLYEPNAIYENPLVTATSREMILDIHNLTRQFADVEVARPRTLIAALFGWGRVGNEPSWFEALKCWSEIGDIVAESESWDGTRRSIIEHTLHILLLPGLHAAAQTSHKSHTPSASTSTIDMAVSQASSVSAAHRPTHPILPFRGFNLPTPFHLQLRIITKLTFNEQGRVSAHRDFWDVRDLTRLIPGGRAAQWVLSRLAGHVLAGASMLLRRREPAVNVSGYEDIQTPRPVTVDTLNALGLAGVAQKSQAPDTDRDAS